MTAQIRPNRMEVSDRFPMLGFSVRTGRPDVEAEVVLASDVALFAPENRTRRTAANFYSSREHGILTVPRGEGVFVVAPEVLARFIGSDRMFFGLATGPAGSASYTVDALPREGSPYVSLRGFTGRTLRRTAAARGSAPRLEWAGDAPQPGSIAADSARTPAMAGAGAPPAGGGNGLYDDGFGPLPVIPAREASFRGGGGGQAPRVGSGIGISMSAGTTAGEALDWIQRRVQQVVGVVGSDVSPPHLFRLNEHSGTFVTAWEAVLGVTGVFSAFNAFLAALPALARTSNVTLSIGPALDTPVFGAGVGVVFAPNGQVALFGAGEISADFGSLREFVTSLKLALQAKMKLGYNSGGLDGFASLAKVGAVNVGEEIVVGAEVWLNGANQGIGGAVSIGVGMAIQLALEEEARQARQAYQANQIQRPAGTALSASTTARQALDWIMEKVRQGAATAGSEVSPPSLFYLRGASGTFISAWQIALAATGVLNPAHAFLAAIPTVARETNLTLSIGPALDTPLFGGGIGVVFAPDGQVALFGTGEVSVSLEGLQEFVSSLKVALQAKIKLGYNGGGLAGFASLHKVAGISLGEEIVGGAELWLDGSNQGIGGAVSIGVGFALQLGVDENSAQPAIVRPALPGDARQRATRIGGSFGPRIGEALDRGLDERSLAPLLDTLDPPAAAQPLSYARSADDVVLAPAPPPRARALIAGEAALAIGGIAIESLRDSSGDISWELDQFRGIKHPNDTAPANPAPFRDGASIRLDDWPVTGGLVDDISAWFQIDWQYNGLSLGNVRISNIGTNDAVAWGLNVRAQIMDDNRPHPPSNCAALRINFHYRFSRSIGSDHIALREIILYGDGTWQSSARWVQAGTLGYSKSADDQSAGGSARRLPAPLNRARAMDAGAIATLAGTAITLLSGHTGDISWSLPQWAGVKHPNDHAPSGRQATYHDAVVELDRWPVVGGTFGIDDIYAWFRIRWQYNGTSLGRVYVEPRGNDDAAGWGLTVTGTIEDDARLYPRSPSATLPGAAQVPCLHVVMHYVFDETIADDQIAVSRITLYADGTHDIASEWIQHSRPGGGTPTNVPRTV